MLIRKFAIAGVLLAAAGLTITATTGVIGMQPGATEKSDDAEEKAATEPPAFDDGFAGGEGRAATGAASADEFGEAVAPPAGVRSSSGKTRGTPKAPARSSGESPRSDRSKPLPQIGAAMSRMPGGGLGMAGMAGSGTMSAAVPEDEHLETWVSLRLAEYSKAEDENARREMRDGIAKALDSIFVIRQERRIQELETLEQRVQKLRVTLETREKLKSDILKDRLDYLIREADGLGWGDGLPVPGRSAPTGIGSAGRSGSSSLGRPGK